MSPILRSDPSSSPYAMHRVTPVARIRAHTESSNAALTLDVRTAEGDTVELSFAATSLKQMESGTGRSSHGQSSYSRTSQSDSFVFKAQVNGDLSGQELADIGSLIESLQSGGSSALSLSSLDAYSGYYQQTASVRDATFRLYVKGNESYARANIGRTGQSRWPGRPERNADGASNTKPE